MQIYFKNVINPLTNTSIKITQSWINYTQPGGFHHKHQHANSFISGVFYIQTNEETDRIYFFKNQYEQLKLAINEWTYYNTESWWFSSIKGQLLLFPSSLTHSVENTSVDSSTRISISFNTFPVGILGIKEELTELCL
ncbi:MAG: hypothetical protein EBZ81_14210 [Betaproteobacteria bacterium]|nr:hypothetical protein [Betaproteobacteria bacterium]